MTKMAKNKGSSGERELCNWFDKNFVFPEKPTRNLEQVRNGGSDITCIAGLCIEVKRVEKLDIQSAWVQCVTASRKMDSQNEPVVAFRYNHKPWEFLISAKHIDLNIGYLRLTERTFIKWAEKFGLTKR